MAKCSCGALLKDGEFVGVDAETGKILIKCRCGIVNKTYMGC
jgi:hypothetical protein